MDLNSLLPQYRSHKIVCAVKIIHLLHIDGCTRAVLDINQGGLWVHAVLTKEMTARYSPTHGDYYVIYDDGYASISPQHAFEAGYSRLDASSRYTQEPNPPSAQTCEPTPRTRRPSDSKWP